MSKLLDKIITTICISYIRLVFRTSKIKTVGDTSLLDPNHDEKFVIGFWHGDCYCFYPLLKNTGFYVITTINKRGDYIENMCKYFGYNPIRVSDESTGQNYIFKIRSVINGSDKRNLAIAFDGPLGPRHEPKKFILMTTLAAKRRVLPLSLKVKRKLVVKKRWDKFIIPLPFSEIEFRVHDPITITKNGLDTTAEEIVRIAGD